MKRYTIVIAAILITITTIMIGCRKDGNEFNPTPYNLEIPDHFPPMAIPDDNPMTVEGVALGRKLFYEELLSGNNTMSCSSCHLPDNNFTDPARFSTGIDGSVGTRNSMVLVNLGWANRFFWDGRAMTLEDQIFEPVTNPIEMKSSWTEAVQKLLNDDEYPNLFYGAFGTREIDSVYVSKAIAQFLRTLISANSKFDAYYKDLLGYPLTAEEQALKDQFTLQEQRGFEIFSTEEGDCFHCHQAPIMVSNVIANNALDATFSDLGLGGVTNNPADNGKFKSQTLRNLELSGPFMHDGRFNTLFDVLLHYNSGLVYSPTVDPNMKKVAQGGLNLSFEDVQALEAFLLSLRDDSFVTNPNFQDPE